MPVQRMEVLRLYKLLLRESSKFPSYNFREYAKIRVKAAFRENKSLSDPKVIQEKLGDANHNLDIIRRQVLIGHMFETERLVIEKM